MSGARHGRELDQHLDAKAAAQLAASLGLLPQEYDTIATALGRVPTRTELSVFAGMWSEHCSYKSTRQWLKDLPKDGKHALAGPGSHAGVAKVSDEWAVAFKVESHNHPSAVEPYQGAATGVGGILRDVIAQGARPCAVMDGLCFGDRGSPRQKHLVEGVVAGIAGYGNAFGVPNVGGRTFFDPRYRENILVNALAAGMIYLPDGMRTASGARPGDSMLYVGATTGRDGILGAAFASEELAEDTVDDRPHVQVGDPFTGKKLMEACLSFTRAMGNVAGQDMGASGITCAATEMAAAGGVGIDIDLETIPLREAGMAPQEILLSESQERFMFAVEADKAEAALAHFRGHGVHAAICGRVIEGDRARARFKGEDVMDLPAALVAGGAPLTRWPLADALPPVEPYPAFAASDDPGKDLLALLADASGASKVPVYGRYDQTVGNRTVRGPDQAEAAVLKLPASHRGFALTLTARGDVCGADARRGTQSVLAEAYRRLACVGAELVAVTDGINVASPRNPVENLRLKELIEGLGEGLRGLGVPVTGGNCSLYNESAAGPIPPTPMIGGLGIVEDVRRVPRHGLSAGQHLLLLGTPGGEPAVSRYGLLRSGKLVGQPQPVDLAAEKQLAALLISQIRAGKIAAAKDASAGGPAVALAKLCLHGGVGARLQWPALPGRADWSLFGEGPAVVVAAVAAEHLDAVLAAARQGGVPAHDLGAAGGERLVITTGAGRVDLGIEAMRRAFATSLTGAAA